MFKQDRIQIIRHTFIHHLTQHEIEPRIMRNKYDEKKQMKKIVPLTELEGELETDLPDHTVTVATLTLGLSPYSSLTDWGASARPLTLSLSAVFKNAGSWSCKYIHQVKVGSQVDAFCHYLRNINLSGIHELKDRGQMLQFYNYWNMHMISYSTLTTWKGTSLRMMMGCLAGFSSSRALK